MIEKGIRGGICYSICRYAKVIDIQKLKDYNKNKESSYLQYCDVSNLCLGNVTKTSSK